MSIKTHMYVETSREAVTMQYATVAPCSLQFLDLRVFSHSLKMSCTVQEYDCLPHIRSVFTLVRLFHTCVHLGMYTVQYSKWCPSLYYACFHHFGDANNDPLKAFVLPHLQCSSEDETGPHCVDTKETGIKKCHCCSTRLLPLASLCKVGNRPVVPQNTLF